MKHALALVLWLVLTRPFPARSEDKAPSAGSSPEQEAPARGDDTGAAEGLSFMRLDADKDGAVSREELLNRFQHADRNADGRLDPSEFSLSIFQ